MKVNVKIKRLSEDAVIPKYAHEWDAGVDLVATADTIVQPGETKIVPTGLAVSLPPNYEMQIRPRSGITVKTKLRVQLGTVDSGYTGPVGVIVDNITPRELTVVNNEIYDQMTYLLYDLEGKEYEVDEDLFERTSPYVEGTIVIPKGTRIAQAVINQVEQAQFQVVEELDETQRGAGGFGSSGVTS